MSSSRPPGTATWPEFGSTAIWQDLPLSQEFELRLSGATRGQVLRMLAAEATLTQVSTTPRYRSSRRP